MERRKPGNTWRSRAARAEASVLGSRVRERSPERGLFSQDGHKDRNELWRIERSALFFTVLGQGGHDTEGPVIEDVSSCVNACSNDQDRARAPPCLQQNVRDQSRGKWKVMHFAVVQKGRAAQSLLTPAIFYDSARAPLLRYSVPLFHVAFNSIR
ncbi:hypothetical protein BaRGS_00008617, partial [Batillaria attramentaria]